MLLLLTQNARAQDDIGDSAIPTLAAPNLAAPADTVLPRIEANSQLSDFREHLLRDFGDTPPVPAADPHVPDLQVGGQFGLAEGYTSNAGAFTGGGQRGGDFITYLQPGITIVESAQRLRVNLNYQPIGQIYAGHSGFSQVEQQFDGDILVTAAPGWLYLDLRGSVGQQSVYGGLGPANSVTLAPDDRETVSSVAVSPYVSRAFGGAGTVEAGAGYIYSATDAPAQRRFPPDGPGDYGSSYLATRRVFASVTSGENLGRLRNRIGTDDDFYQGSGALAGGRRVLVTDDAGYAVSRLVTLLGEAGYEDLSYPRSAFFTAGPVGAAGVQLTPNRLSTLTLEYRYLDGFGSAFVQGSVQVTPRVRVYGGYSAGISTQQQDVQNALLGADAGTTGIAASALQAPPLLGGSNAFGSNQNLERLHRLDASAIWAGRRDTVTMSVQRETTDPVGHLPAAGQLGRLPAASTSGMFGSIGEQHDIDPVTSLAATLQYGSNRTGLTNIRNESGDTVGFSISLDRRFTETLTGYIRAGGTYAAGGSALAATGAQGANGDDTTVTVGALKRF